MDPPANKIGRYLVLEGGPVRFVAYDPELGRKVDLEVGIDPRMRRRAQRVAQLVHPNVVRLHDVGVHGERLYLAFDHVEGETVRSWCERERPSWRSVLEAFVDAGEGIAAAHRAGLVHGAIDLDALVRGDDERVRVRELVRSEDVDIVEGEPDSERDRVAFARALETALSGSTKDVPRRLRRVLQEGLDADRPMSIDAFVSRLRRERPRARRWAWSIAAMALVAAGFAARGDDAHRDIASVTYCGTFDARLAKLWNAEVRDEVARGVAALEAEFAVAAWDGAATRLDTYVDELARAQARDCSRREAGEAVPEAVSLCLHRRFESLNTFLRALEQPSTSMMANLSDSLGTLGSPQQCEALDNAGPPVIGVDLAVLLDLEAQLSDAAMQSRLGRPADAIVSAKKAMRVAESIPSKHPSSPSLRPAHRRLHSRSRATARHTIDPVAFVPRSYHRVADAPRGSPRHRRVKDTHIGPTTASKPARPLWCLRGATTIRTSPSSPTHQRQQQPAEARRIGRSAAATAIVRGTAVASGRARFARRVIEHPAAAAHRAATARRAVRRRIRRGRAAARTRGRALPFALRDAVDEHAIDIAPLQHVPAAAVGVADRHRSAERSTSRLPLRALVGGAQPDAAELRLGTTFTVDAFRTDPVRGMADRLGRRAVHRVDARHHARASRAHLVEARAVGVLLAAAAEPVPTPRILGIRRTVAVVFTLPRQVDRRPRATESREDEDRRCQREPPHGP